MKRRSANKSTPRKKYTTDAFEHIPELRGASEEEDLQAITPRSRRFSTSQNVSATRPTKKHVHVATSSQVLGDDDSHEDANAVKQAKHRWVNDLTLPSRKSGFHFSRSDEEWNEVSRHGWQYYVEGGGEEAFGTGQVSRTLTTDEAEGRASLTAGACSFVMGPYKDQQLFRLEPGGSVALSQAWISPGDDDNNLGSAPKTRPDKNGFMLNIGAPALGLQWVPITQGKDQYLFQYLTVTTSDDSTGAASSIPIWRLRADGGSIDTTVAPELKLTVHTVWGAVKACSWCDVPIPSADSLGLLAVMFTDGAVRVLDIPQLDDDNAASHLLFEEAHVEFAVPGIACTSTAWLTPTKIAVGCANGWLFVPDFEASAASPDEPATDIMSVHISDSAVLTVASCTPSHPHRLLTSSADGYTRVVDLDQSKTLPTTIHAEPTIFAHPMPIWHEHSQSPLSVDDNCRVLAHDMRNGSNSSAVLQAKSILTTLAASTCHPIILVGSASGEVIATNPLQDTSGGSTRWQQTWFAHEWRREVNSGREGIGRVLDGFKSEGVASSDTQKGGGGAYAVQERKTAITAVAWNPNKDCGGWAAAAMADGLVRIEDIALQHQSQYQQMVLSSPARTSP